MFHFEVESFWDRYITFELLLKVIKFYFTQEQNLFIVLFINYSRCPLLSFWCYSSWATSTAYLRCVQHIYFSYKLCLSASDFITVLSEKWSLDILLYNFDIINTIADTGFQLHSKFCFPVRNLQHMKRVSHPHNATPPFSTQHPSPPLSDFHNP